MIWCAWLFYGACAVYVVVYLHVCLGCLGDGWVCLVVAFDVVLFVYLVVRRSCGLSVSR